MTTTELLVFYSEISAEYDQWLADSYSSNGPGGKPWSEERCKLRARVKTREEKGTLPEEVRWALRFRLGVLEPS